MLHGGKYTVNKVIWDINNTFRSYVKLKFKDTIIPRSWPRMVASLDDFEPVYQTQVIRWLPPLIGWWK